VSMSIELKVDWEATDWTVAPDYSQDIDDISDYLMEYDIDRGQKVEQGNAPAGVATFTLNNSDGRFSPTNSSSPLYGYIRPWLPIRLRATVNASTYTVYTGFISRILCFPSSRKQIAMFYCTDGMDLLARNMVTQDESTTSTATTDGDAVGYVLDAAGWPALRRNLATDGGNIANYPLTVEY